MVLSVGKAYIGDGVIPFLEVKKEKLTELIKY